MRRALWALLILSGAACSGTAATSTATLSSSSSAFGTLGGSGASSSGSRGISGSGIGSIGASGSHGTSGSTGASGTNGVSGSNGASTGVAGTNGASTGATSSGASVGSTNGASSGTAGTTSSSGGTCVANDGFAGVGNMSACCTGLVLTSAGFCEEPGANSSSSSGSPTGTSAGGTTGTVTTGGTGVGTTSGGTCPMNMPNLETGQTTTVAGACSETGEGTCPTGFSCINRQCILHGSDGQLQITMSWDDPEDLDLHVVEPSASGGCEIWYGNVGDREFVDGGLDLGASSTFDCTPVGWLDRDSNPACNFDNVDVENVIYPPNVTPPAGMYTVRADFWTDCAGDSDTLGDGGTITVQNYSEIPYAIQVRRNGAVYVYCDSFAGGTEDHGSLGSGTVVTTFTLP